MDNRVFNVNGKGLEMLARVMALAFDQNGTAGAVAYRIDPKFGIIWEWSVSNGSQLVPAELTAAEAASITIRWLSSPDAWKIELSDWDEDEDHDGSNEKGWRVFVGDWGHVGDSRYVLCAVTPAYLWMGK